MKKVILGLVLLLTTSQVFAGYWYVRAESYSAWGSATAGSLSQAKRMALYECAIRTPYGDTCYVIQYYWVN